MAPSLRPDKSKVVIMADEVNFVARVDPKFPLAWQKRGIVDLLARLSDKLRVLVDNGKHTWVIDKRGVREVIMSEADQDGVERFQEYV